MSRAYITVDGDDYSSVSRKQYGTEDHSPLIESANPGAGDEPFVAGIVLDIPDVPGEPQNVFQDTPATNQNEVAILVDGKRFRFWEALQITRSLDSIDTVSLGAPFDADLPNFRETFVPFSYKPIQVTVGGDLLFNGTMVAITPPVDAEKKIVGVSAYSLPGVLNDCVAPISAIDSQKETSITD